MMYKDKDRQASQRRRDKGMAQGMTNEGQTAVNEQTHVIPCNNKRGKDIKCFLDLPLDVQQTIERLCPDVVKDHEERCRRTAIAVNYQHQLPDRYHSTGVAE